jgi:fumarate reductase subunit C
MTASPAPSPTRTLPARPPDGFWRHHRHYFWYVLFAGTGFVLSVICLLLLIGLHALAGGISAWQTYLAVLRSPPLVAIDLFLLSGLLYFAIRFLWVGVKIPTVRLGSVPAPPAGLVCTAHFAGFIALTLVLLILFSGVVV